MVSEYQQYQDATAEEEGEFDEEEGEYDVPDGVSLFTALENIVDLNFVLMRACAIKNRLFNLALKFRYRIASEAEGLCRVFSRTPHSTCH